MPKTLKVVAATGNLSAGFKEETLSRAAEGAAVIGCDAGSTDSGPYYLGSGQPRGPREGVKRNLRLILREALKAGIPAIIGTAGFAGARPHLEWLLTIVRELGAENAWHFKLGSSNSEVDKQKLVQALRADKISPLDPAPAFNEQTITSAERFVAMMGVEPIQRAFKAGSQVIICGRCSDIAIYAALPMLRGVPASVAFHAAKILECGAACVVQRFYPDSMSAELDSDGFIVEPPNPAMRCTPQSVAAHTLYENADPYRLVEPGGVLETSSAVYSPVSDRAVRVTGSRFIPSPTYTVRLEGASLVGYRSVAFAGIRDPLVLKQLDSFLTGLRAVVESKVQESLSLQPSQYTLNWRVYGRNGTMGQLEPEIHSHVHEVGLVIDVVASNQTLAAGILGIAAHTGLHHPVPEQEGMISNFAYPFSPPGIDVGPVYEFCVNHVWSLDDPCSPFEMTIEQL